MSGQICPPCTSVLYSILNAILITGLVAGFMGLAVLLWVTGWLAEKSEIE